jgi:hypothetical protein
MAHIVNENAYRQAATLRKNLNRDKSYSYKELAGLRQRAGAGDLAARVELDAMPPGISRLADLLMEAYGDYNPAPASVWKSASPQPVPAAIFQPPPDIQHNLETRYDDQAIYDEDPAVREAAWARREARQQERGGW